MSLIRSSVLASIASLLTISAAFSLTPESVPGEIIVRYKKDFRRDRKTMTTLYSAISAEKVFRYTGIMKDYERISVPAGKSTKEVMHELSKNPGVELVQENYYVYIQPVQKKVTIEATPTTPPRARANGSLWPSRPSPTQPPVPTATPAPTPTPTKSAGPSVKNPPSEVIPPVADPRLQELYGLKVTEASQIWEKQNGKNILIADIDTGVDYNHEDLSFNMWRNPNPTQGDLVGYDFVHNDALPFDDHGHGTHTSGTIAGVGGNGKGITGVAPRASIMAIKAFNAGGRGTLADAIRAFDYAVANGAQILSNSWGGAKFNDPLMLDAIKRAEAKGVLVVFAAGNARRDMDVNPDYPSSFALPNMISVAATDSSDQVAEFSNYGKKSVDLAAPGVGILSSIPGNRYDTMDGTSMACPHVAGAAALVWAKNPRWNYAQVKEALLKSVDTTPELLDKTISGGRLNIRKALGL